MRVCAVTVVFALLEFMQSRIFLHTRVWTCLILSCAGLLRAAEPSPGLTLDDALRKGLMHHPALAPYAWEIQARDAAINQSSRPPNPILGVEVEDVAGTGRFGGTREAQTTLSVSQPLELGGKRKLRTEIAQTARTEAELQLEFQKQEVTFEVRKAFLAVLLAQEKVRLLGESAKLAREVADTVKAKVEAGKVSPVELVKARSAQATSEKDRQLAVLELESARNQLAITWGATSADFKAAQGDLAAFQPQPDRRECVGLLMTNAAVRLSQTGVRRSEEELRLAGKNRLPDVTISAGYRNFSSGNDHAMLFGASVPLPIFRQQTDAMTVANARLEKARAEEAALRQRLHGEMLGHLSVLERAREESRSFNDEQLPAAREIFTKTREGYAGGKFSYLDLLDAQRVLLESRLQHLDVLYRYQLARAELDRLLGLSFEEKR